MTEPENLENDKLIEKVRKEVIDKITLESGRLLDELLKIIYNPEVEAKVKLPAISMLLDRSISKKGVTHDTQEAEEETSTSKRLRAEITELVNRGKQ